MYEVNITDEAMELLEWFTPPEQRDNIFQCALHHARRLNHSKVSKFHLAMAIRQRLISTSELPFCNSCYEFHDEKVTCPVRR